MENELSFEEFEPFSSTDWRELAEKELKGKPFDDFLVWKSKEGFEQTAWQGNEKVDPVNVSHPSSPWFVLEPVLQISGETNKKILESLNAGAEGLYFTAQPSTSDWKNLLQGVQLEYAPVYGLIENKPREHLLALKDLVGNAGPLQGGLLFDPIGHFLQKGSWPEGWDKELKGLSEIPQAGLPSFKTIGVTGSAYHHAGTGIVHEIAFVFLHALEYVSTLEEQGAEKETALNAIAFELAFNHHFLAGIAKTRALKKLWESYWKSQGIHTKAHALGTTARNNKSSGDEHTNILRATVETMAAVLGGCQAIATIPWDAHFREPHHFSARISRNIQLLLKEEGRLDKILNPVDGSFYLDSLTEQIAKGAWGKIQEVHSKGSFMDYILSGSLNVDISADRKQKIDSLKNSTITMIGVNKFRGKGQEKEQTGQLYDANEAILPFWNRAAEAEKAITQ